MSGFRRSGPSQVDVPGKVLLLGEYAVLAGGPALLAAVSVRFRYARTTGGADGLEVHSKSPAGRLLAAQGPGHLVQGRRDDLWVLRLKREVIGGSALGVGSSTADFLAIYSLLNPSGDCRSAWTTYRELHREEEVPPSGADLVCQWNGGVGVFEIEGAAADENPKWRSSKRDLPNAPVLLLQASHQEGRKTATHEHLSRMLSSMPTFRELEPLARRAIAAFEREDWAAFGFGVRDFSAWLSSRGFEHPRTREDRLALESIPGVLAAKGCGAMLSDSLLVVTDGDAATADAVLELARVRDLRRIESGLPAAGGIASAP